jgi:integrase
VVTVGSGTLAALEVLHDRAFTDALACGETLPKQAFVFTDDPVGEVPWRPATTARRFRRACEVAGLPDTTRLHDLRHLAATYLIDRGVSVPTVSARLGHSQPSTTLDVYTGRVEASDVIAGEVMEQLFGDDAG